MKKAANKHNIELNISILKYIAMWPTSFTGYRRNLYLLYSWSLVACITLLIIPGIAALFEYIEDLQKFTIDSCTILVTISAVGKIMGFLLMSRQHNEVVEMFKKNIILETQYPRFVKSNSRQLTIAYFISGGIMSIMWGSVPILKIYFIDNVTMKDTNDSYIWELPNIALYPYDVSKTPSYEITYVCQVIIGILFSTATIAADTFYITMLIHTTAQLRILRKAFLKYNQNYLRSRADKLTDGKIGQRRKQFRFERRIGEASSCLSCKAISPCCLDTGVEGNANSGGTRCRKQLTLPQAMGDLKQYILHHTDLIR